MSIDYQAQLYNPIYASELCVDATITTTGGVAMPMRAKNATQPTSFSNSSGVLDFHAFRPAAIVRMAQLLDLNPDLIIQDDIQGGEIEMDGKSWSIKSYEYIPAPTGINTGELRLFLKDDLNL